jgi:hypothetical protein
MKLFRIGSGRSGVLSDHDTSALLRVKDIKKRWVGISPEFCVEIFCRWLHDLNREDYQGVQ